MIPTLEIQTVPSEISLLATLPASADFLNLFSSSWIYTIFRFWQFFILGTTKPLGESIATEILWFLYVVN